MPLTRRGFVGLSLAGAAATGIAYARFLEPRRLETTRVDVPLGSPPFAPFRVLHLSDLHWSRDVPLSLIEEAIERGLAEGPDLVCLTGDYISAGDKRDLARYVPVLARLARRAPTCAVLGNNDGGRWCGDKGGYDDPRYITETLEAAGVRLLVNAAEALDLKGSRVTVVGIGDLWAGDANPAAAFRGLPAVPAGPVILLAHNPDAKEMAGDWAWHLMLSGHTHGGQIVLPWLGPPVLHLSDRRYASGLVPWRDRLVHVTRGVGSIYGIRFNCRPEVSVLELRPA